MKSREGRLDPVRRPILPRPSTALRGLLVAVLLSLAAAALYADPGSSSARPPGPAPNAPAASAGPRAQLPVPAGLVGVPIGLADPALLAVVRPGDRVDLLALPASAGRRSTVLASGVLVLGVSGAAEAPVLYVALGDAQARNVMDSGPDVRFGVIVRSP